MGRVCKYILCFLQKFSMIVTGTVWKLIYNPLFFLFPLLQLAIAVFLLELCDFFDIAQCGRNTPGIVAITMFLNTPIQIGFASESLYSGKVSLQRGLLTGLTHWRATLALTATALGIFIFYMVFQTVSEAYSFGLSCFIDIFFLLYWALALPAAAAEPDDSKAIGKLFKRMLRTLRYCWKELVLCHLLMALVFAMGVLLCQEEWVLALLTSYSEVFLILRWSEEPLLGTKIALSGILYWSFLIPFEAQLYKIARHRAYSRR